MNKRTAIGMGAALVALGFAGEARAQAGAAFGSAGQPIVSADRLFGVYFWSVKSQADATPADPNPQIATQSGTAINLLWGSDSSFVAGGTADVYSVPRLAFDYTVIDHLSVGGSIGYLNRSGKTETTMDGVTTSRDSPTGFALLFSPRVGFAIALSPMVAIWPRLGITYFTASTQSTNMAMPPTTTKTTLNGFALSMDAELVITPLSHVGFTVGPMLDLPLSGRMKIERTGGTNNLTESSAKITNYGLTAGLLVYF